MRMVLRLLVILALPVITLGCTTNPGVRVTGIDKVSSGATADEYALRVELRNPSDESLVLDRWEYAVTTNAGAWQGEWIASRTLPARSITVDTLPVVLGHAAEPIEVTNWRVTGNLRFLRKGQLAETLFDLGVSRPDVDFSASGVQTSIGAEAPAVNSR